MARTREHEVARAALHDCEVRIALLRGKIEGTIDGIREDKVVIEACAAESKRTGEPAADIMDQAVEAAKARHLPTPSSSGPITDDMVTQPVTEFRKRIGAQS